VDESDAICAADINDMDIFYIPFGSAAGQRAEWDFVVANTLCT